MYWVGYELTSCCNCIKYICEMNRTGNCDAYFWMKRVDTQYCCIQCDATVYPKVADTLKCCNGIVMSYLNRVL